MVLVSRRRNERGERRRQGYRGRGEMGGEKREKEGGGNENKAITRGRGLNDGQKE